MAKGNTSGGYAYTRLGRLDNGISQSLQYWGGLAAQRGVEDRARQEREGIRKQKERVDWEEKWNMKEKDFLNTVTGFDTYDDIARDGTNYIMDKYIDYNRLAKEALDNGNLKAKNEYEMKMMKLKSSFGNVKNFQDHFAKLNADYVKMANEGKVSGVDKEWENIMQSIIMKKNVSFRTDKDDNLVYLGFYEGEDGEQIPFEIKQSDMINGTFRPYQKQQIAGKGGLIDGILHTLGKMKKDEITGYTITTNQIWDKERETATNIQIDSMLESDEVMADLYYQITDGKSTKRKDFTNKERELVKTKMFDLVRAGYDEEIKYDYDSKRASAENQRERLKFDEKKLAQEMAFKYATLAQNRKQWAADFEKKNKSRKRFCNGK